MDNYNDVTLETNFIETNNISKMYIIDGEEFDSSKSGVWFDSFLAKTLDLKVGDEITFTYQKYKFLYMGDASITTEDNLLENYNLNNISILKVGHHGSNTSSSKDFISQINPSISLISVGENNIYHHPNKEVINNLFKSRIYRTDINNMVKLTINSKGILKVTTIT